MSQWPVITIQVTRLPNTHPSSTQIACAEISVDAVEGSVAQFTRGSHTISLSDTVQIRGWESRPTCWNVPATGETTWGLLSISEPAHKLRLLTQ